MKLIIIKHKAYTRLVYGSYSLIFIPSIIDIIIWLITGYHPWNSLLLRLNILWFLAIEIFQLIFTRTYWRGLVYEIRLHNDKITLNYLINKSHYGYLADITITEDNEKIYFSDDKKLNVYLFKKDLREEDYGVLKEVGGR